MALIGRRRQTYDPGSTVPAERGYGELTPPGAGLAEPGGLEQPMPDRHQSLRDRGCASPGCV